MKLSIGRGSALISNRSNVGACLGFGSGGDMKLCIGGGSALISNQSNVGACLGV